MKKITQEEIKNFVSCSLFNEDKILKRDPKYPRISIITPSFNQADFLERTILSVLNQNYPNLEFIIIDGGSTDKSVEIIKKYEKYLACWVNEKDNGQSHAINKGIKKATGELIGWQNSDDLYLPDAFYEIARMYQENNDCGIFSGNVVSIDENENILRQSKFIKPTFRKLIYEGFVMSSQGVFWKRNIHDIIGYFREDLNHAMDYDFWLKCLQYEKSCFTDKILGCFRIRPGTKTSMKGDIGTQEVNEIKECYGINPSSMKFQLTRFLLRFYRLSRWMIVKNLLYK